MINDQVQQILIAGAGTAAWWNAGDEAILSAMLLELRSQFPNAKFGVISANPKGTLATYNVQEITTADIQSLIEFAQKSNLLILGGGGLFYDYWGFAVDELLTEAQGGAGIYVGFSLLATLLNKPLMIYAVGVGPLFFDKAKHYTKLAFEQAKGITVRDDISKKLLVSLGLSPEKIHVTADPVWGYPEVSLENGKAILEKIGIINSPFIIGISVRPWQYPNNEDWERQIARALDLFIDSQSINISILFIPFHKNDGSVDDYAQSEKIIKLMKHSSKVQIIDAEIDLDTKISVLRHCNLILGMRLHANIFAMRYGIPAIGLAYDPKVKNLFQEVGRPDYVLDLQILTAESLQFCLWQAWKNNDQLVEFYKKTNETMLTLAKKNTSIAASLILHPPPLISPLPPSTFEWVKSLLLKSTINPHKKLTVQITEQQSQIQEQQSQIHFLTTQLEAMKSSFFWKITLPLRFLRTFISSPQQSAIRLLIYLWTKFPSPFRERFSPFIQRLKRVMLRLYQIIKGIKPDLTWQEFHQKILTLKNRYQGVFVLYSTVDWNFSFAQRPQPLASALGRLGYLIIYHTPNHIDLVSEVRQVEPNVWLTNVNVDKISIENSFHAVYSTSLTTSIESLQQIRKKGQALIYEYIDHVSPLISGEGKSIQHLLELKQFAFQGGVDFIVASAKQLEIEAEKALGHENVVYVPNGVDVEHYLDPIHKNTTLPKELLSFRNNYQTTVGYFGAIAPWLWYEMIEELTQMRPDLGFIFIGPDYLNGLAQLPKKPNILYVGAVNYKILPAYARLFDICLIPFAPGEIARTTSPLKLFEYFALGKPVVVTSFMDECVAYDAVFSGNSASAISEGINKAVNIKDNSEYINKLNLLAKENSWDERAKAYENILTMNTKYKP